jgi:hypothetical protein
VSPDAPTPKAVWGSPQALRNFSVVRKLEGRPWPTGESTAQHKTYKYALLLLLPCS